LYELIKVSERCYYVSCPCNVGIVKISDTEACLIDSGSDKDSAKKVLKHLNANNWTLRAIYTTHSNADHIGGNKYLQEQSGCKIYAYGIERDFSIHPILEPSYIYGGFPPKELRNKFILAQESNVLPLDEACLPEGFKMIPLPGHFFDMVGFIIDGDVFYIADSVSSKQTLDKYKIGVIYDAREYLNTLSLVKNTKVRVYVPSHNPHLEDISELCEYNEKCTHDVAKTICGLLNDPICFDELLKRLFDHFGLNLSFQQYALVGSTVRSYLSYLKEKGFVEVVYDQNFLLWHKTENEYV